MKRPALQNKQDVLLRMAFRARKVLGTFEKRAPEDPGIVGMGICEGRHYNTYQPIYLFIYSFI